MTLQDRVTALERRLENLESQARGAAPSSTREALQERGGDFWALETWKEKLGEAGAGNGGVLFTGAVGLPSDGRYEWQRQSSTDALLENDWSESADCFAALGHSVRLRLLREILHAARTVPELAALDDLGTTGQIYHHIRQLTGTGWLHTVSRGRYEVPPDRVVPLLVMLTASRR